MATPDPLQAHQVSEPRISQKSFVIAGIITDVYGLDEVPSAAQAVSCLWLLHPRLGTKERMSSVAEAAIRAWNSGARDETSRHGLIAVTFDQRNHGTRLADRLANEAWRGGNPRHAQDMYSIYQGTAADASALLTYLPSYIYPSGERAISNNVVLGVSLGGHAAWHCILHDDRFKSAVVVIGCADYVKLMMDRAAKSKLETWTASTPPGSSFLGSRDLSTPLLKAIDETDPAGLLMARMMGRTARDTTRPPTERELEHLLPLMQKHLARKRILNMAGGADKLVPYAESKPFLDWLKAAIGPGGWYAGHGVQVEDKVYEGVGHEMTAAMLDDAVNYVIDSIHAARRGSAGRI